MAFEDGIGFKVVKTLATAPANKTYFKVKQVTDLSVKNYISVKETSGQNKDYTEVLLVDYDEPKDYLRVNYVVGSRQYYNFDGVDDYIEIPTVNLVAGDTVTFRFTGNDGLLSGNHTPIDTVSRSRVRILSGVWNIGGGTATINGEPLTTNMIPPTSGEHEVVFTLTGATTFSEFGKQTGSGNHFGGVLYDLGVTAVSGSRFYPIDDGWADNPAIRDTVGGQDGTAINFNEENWTEL